MLLTRILSALILAPLVIGVIWIGGWPFYILLMLAFCIAAYEFVQLMWRSSFQPPLFFSIALMLILWLNTLFPQTNLLQPAVAFILISSLTWQLTHRQGAPTVDWALALIGGLYLGMAGAHFMLTRRLPEGERWLLLLLTGTWLADSGAYFVGSRVWPPKK